MPDASAKQKKTRLKNKIPLVISCLLIIGVLVGLDQWTKSVVVQSIPLYERVEVIHNFFDLTNVRNTGMAFSMMEGAGMGFFALMTALAVGAMVYYFFKTDDIRIELCLSLITAGAIGNLIDRMSLGYVRDFFLFYIFGWPFPVFNVADVCITMGVIFLLVIFIGEEWKEKKKTDEAKRNLEHNG